MMNMKSYRGRMLTSWLIAGILVIISGGSHRYFSQRFGIENRVRVNPPANSATQSDEQGLVKDNPDSEKILSILYK